MTRRERMKRCFYHEELDRPAVYCRDSFPPDDPSYDRLKAYMAEHMELKTRWRGGPVRNPLAAFVVEERTEPFTEDFQRRITVVRTPTGDLRSVRLVSLHGQPGRQEEYLLSTEEDAEKLLSLPHPDVRCDLSPYFDAVARIGDAGVVVADLGQNVGYVNKLLGSEAFAVLSKTARDTIHALCRRQTEHILRYLDFLLDGGAGPFFGLSGEEQVAPPLHGPEDFRDFNVRYDRPIIERIHAAGGRIHVHCHGSLRKVFRDFVALGVDILHPFEAPPMGDIEAAEAKELARGKMSLEGNIQIDRMYQANPDDLRAEVRRLIEQTFDDRRGLVVSPTASPYIYGAGEACLPRYRAMVEEVEGWTS